jgi:hypothetical protein
VSLHLKMDIDPVSETVRSLDFRIQATANVQKLSDSEPNIVCMIFLFFIYGVWKEDYVKK